MSDIERELSELLAARADQARVGGGSVDEVRMLSRRRTRRRGVAGAGMLVAASTLGIGALISRNPEPQRVANASGQGAGQPQGSWRCSGPIDHTDMTGVSDPEFAEQIRQQNLILHGAQPAADGFYYMSDCEFTTELPPSPPAVEVAPAGTEVASTEIKAANTEPSENAPTSTVEVPDRPVSTLAPIVAGCISSNAVPELVLNPDCWALLQQQQDADILLENIRQYVESVGRYEIYTVALGDYLYGIAESYGIDVQRLADANGGSSDLIVFVGRPLLIPLNG